MNNIHFIPAGFYRYYDPKILRIAFAVFPDKISSEERVKIISSEEPLTNEEKILLNFIDNNIEDKKKREEFNKRIAEEDKIVESVAKRPYSGFYLYGSYFPRSDMKTNVNHYLSILVD